MIRLRSLLLVLPAVPLSGAAAPVDFVREVQPIFAAHCYGCHGPDKQKSGYRLDIKKEALQGGDVHAPNILAGQASESPLYRFVSGESKDMQMPPKKAGKPGLAPGELATLKRWLDEGAAWPDGVDTARTEDRMDWWAFKPLRRPEAPALTGANGQAAASGVIDAFVESRRREQGLQGSPEADRRTLIRRLSFDLTGLPPRPEEVAAFVNDADPCAYERLVDRLLASPAYGERWARHWLDVVHFGETHGYDKDKPRNNAWPYRDYVIRSFNADKPYARFVEEQLAGDVLHPGTADGIEALGFIAAGPWDLIGHMEVPESKTDGKIARHLDRDDMVQNTMGAFMSLTVGCAQCHFHKFDPVSQEDYYSLQAVFAALDRADKRYYRDPALTRRRTELEDEQHQLMESKRKLDAAIAAKAGPALADLDKAIEAAKKAARGNSRPEFGYHSAVSPLQDTPKWVQVDLGRQVAVDQVVLAPCFDNFNNIGAGFGFPLKYKVELGDSPDFTQAVTLVVEKSQEKGPGVAPQHVPSGGARGRYVRVTALTLAPRNKDYIFALAELQVLDEAGHNLAAGGPVTALDSIEAGPRWAKKNLVDGAAPGFEPGNDASLLASLEAKRGLLVAGAAPPRDREKLQEITSRLSRVTAALDRMPAPQAVYAGTVHHGAGAFTGTGPMGGRPRVIQVLKRGDVKTPEKEVGPGGIAAFDAVMEPFACAVPAAEGQRRAALARWITSRANPLTWRSLVNRVWQHHFGRALVDTPNDFGRMGALPTHPELLDWLAAVFRDDLGGSLKSLHKLIVMSAAYRQQSAGGNPPAEAADAGNLYLWRQNRRKLEAEAVRDAILDVSGRLDLTMGGPSFQDFVVEKPGHSPHYEYHLHDPNDPRTHRRSIYRFIVRSQQQPFMTVLDCADPSMRVDKRNESLSPLQALAMLNNGLTVTMAEHFAARLQRERPTLPAQVERAFHLALARPPSAEEQQSLVTYAGAHGLANACRVILNLNEFTFVD